MPSTNGHGSKLSERQLQLLAYVASGLTIDQAAAKVHVAKQSAYNTLSAARGKANAATVTQLAVLAIDCGWLEKTESGEYVPSEKQAV